MVSPGNKGWTAALLLLGTLAGCAADGECDPGFDFNRDGWGCAGPCPEGQVCQDMTRCVPMGCSKDPECATRPETYNLSSHPNLGHPSPKARTFSGTIKIENNGFSVVTPTGSLDVYARLPADMDLPISGGESVTLKVCYHGNPINANYNVVLRDAKGALIAAGGWGIDAALTGCLEPEVSIAREDLDCAPFPGGKEYDSSYPHANYALRFAAGSARVVVPQRGRASLTVKGQAYRVANFMSYHPIETPATDIYGALESFAIVREK